MLNWHGFFYIVMVSSNDFKEKNNWGYASNCRCDNHVFPTQGVSHCLSIKPILNLQSLGFNWHLDLPKESVWGCCYFLFLFLFNIEAIALALNSSMSIMPILKFFDMASKIGKCGGQTLSWSYCLLCPAASSRLCLHWSLLSSIYQLLEQLCGHEIFPLIHQMWHPHFQHLQAVPQIVDPRNLTFTF